MNIFDPLLDNSGGKKLFLLGNEAIVRGLIEGNVGYAVTYPGTPSSEVGDTLYQIHEKAGIKFEFSVNEKVAIESCFAASVSGVRSFVFMKHVGLNVASDPMMSIAYTGVNAGMVIMTADDPSMFSSQNEQDNRNYARIAHIPLIEPSNAQECKDFIKYAFELSERFHIPVIFRTTTRVSHQRGMVVTSLSQEIKSKGHFTSEKNRFNALPVNSRRLKMELLDKMKEISKESDNTFLNFEINSEGTLGIITSGASYGYVQDFISDYELKIDVLKLSLTYPLPSTKIIDFLKRYQNVVIIEELDPILESDIRNIAQMNNLNTNIHGKMTGEFPAYHEYNEDIIATSVLPILDIIPPEFHQYEDTLPPRPPVLCPGCPHRPVFYTVKRALRMSNIKDVIFSSDIGCYSLGIYEPFETSDLIISMGASEGMANGFSKVTDQPVIAFIGDSTFFHSGIPPLINAVHNGNNFKLIIMDNSTTAMTGHQPNPGISKAEGNLKSISIEDIVKSIGIKDIVTVNSFDVGDVLKNLTAAFKRNGVSVIITRGECAILSDKRTKKSGTLKLFDVDNEKCNKCMNCVENFSCPALYIENENIKINPNLCDGCGVCAEIYVCPYKAIKVIPREN
ncbi:MAG: indolepyruvate ferredoxin oxidoreductase subunit alpha [Thermoplasmataceae archaeon]